MGIDKCRAKGSGKIFIGIAGGIQQIYHFIPVIKYQLLSGQKVAIGVQDKVGANSFHGLKF